MEEIAIPSREDNLDAFRQFQAMSGGPAYLRRARAVEGAFEQLLSDCRKQRDEGLSMVRLFLATLRSLAGDWDRLRPIVDSPDELRFLEQLHDELSPKLRSPIEPSFSPRVLRRALAEFRESLTFFNRRWEKHLTTLDLTKINALRDGYNRFYLLEKECALRSPRLARAGYTPLSPLQAKDLFALFPPLRIPSAITTPIKHEE